MNNMIETNKYKTLLVVAKAEITGANALCRRSKYDTEESKSLQHVGWGFWEFGRKHYLH